MEAEKEATSVGTSKSSFKRDASAPLLSRLAEERQSSSTPNSFVCHLSGSLGDVAVHESENARRRSENCGGSNGKGDVENRGCGASSSLHIMRKGHCGVCGRREENGARPTPLQLVPSEARRRKKKSDEATTEEMGATEERCVDGNIHFVHDCEHNTANAHCKKECKPSCCVSSSKRREKMTFRFVESIESEYAFHKKDSIIGKGAYSVVYRAVRLASCQPSAVSDVSAAEASSSSVAPGTHVALKVISKVPEGFDIRSSAAAAAATPITAAAAEAKGTHDDRRDDVVRELEVLSRLRYHRTNEEGEDAKDVHSHLDEGSTRSEHGRRSDFHQLYNGCLQLLDAMETATHWCLVTRYEPAAIDLATYFRRKMDQERKPEQLSPLPSSALFASPPQSLISSSSSAAAALLPSSSSSSCHTPFSEAHAGLIIVQLLAITHRLHEEQRLVHRDLKPENILIGPVPPSRPVSSSTATASEHSVVAVGNRIKSPPSVCNKSAVSSPTGTRSQQQQGGGCGGGGHFPPSLPPLSGLSDDENKKLRQRQNAINVEDTNSNKDALREAGLVTLLDFGFSRFLHTDSVVCLGEEEDTNKQSTASAAAVVGGGVSAMTVVPTSQCDPQKISFDEKRSSSAAPAAGSSPAAECFSTLVASPVVPTTPLTFPTVAPNVGDDDATQNENGVDGNGNVCYMLGRSATTSSDIFIGEEEAKRESLMMASNAARTPSVTATSNTPSNNRSGHTTTTTTAATAPAPLLLLTSCGTDKFLPFEVLLWTLKRTFYPCVPAGLPPSFTSMLVSSQPQHRPTTIPHAKALDCFAIGVVAHILLSGKLPFDGSNRTALFLQQNNVRITPPKAGIIREVLVEDGNVDGGGSGASAAAPPSPFAAYAPNQVVRGEEGVVALDSVAWKGISEGAKTLVRGLLHVNPSKRWSIKRALACPWVKHVALPIAHDVLPEEIWQGLSPTPASAETR